VKPGPRPDLDVQLPFHEGRGFPPPVFSNEQYIRFIEFNRRVLIENGTFAGIIARRPRPVEEMFVLK